MTPGWRKTRSIQVDPRGNEISSPEVGIGVPSLSRDSRVAPDADFAAASDSAAPTRAPPPLTLDTGFGYTTAARRHRSVPASRKTLLARSRYAPPTTREVTLAAPTSLCAAPGGPPDPVDLSGGGGVEVTNSTSMMSFRRLVHLVVDDKSIRSTFSLRSIDMLSLFKDRPPHPMEEELKPSPLPAPSISFYPPRRSRYTGGALEFMLLGGKHSKVVATDHTGRAALYDPDQHAVLTLRSLATPKSLPISLTIDDDHLYILDTIPREGSEDQCFECLEYDRDGDEDWHPRVLPPPPYKYDPCMWETTPSVDSYAAVGGGSCILISKAHFGTYSFDTATEVWRKAGDWTLPFSGRAEYVPELGLWFGLRDRPAMFCAVDLGSAASTPRPPVVCNLWKDFTAPAEWGLPGVSHLVHLGSARFCIARFFDSKPRSYPVTHAVLTAVEVVRCDNNTSDGGIRMVKHGSKLYTLLENMSYWVL